jgi:hypothetical protein
MASVINAVSGSGITQTADGSGVLKIQSNSVTTNALAWVNFNGTGTVAIRSSYNVSSITDNGTGNYTVNFATALSDANYAVAGQASNAADTATNTSRSIGVPSYSTSSFTLITTIGTASANDFTFVNAIVFGN